MTAIALIMAISILNNVRLKLVQTSQIASITQEKGSLHCKLKVDANLVVRGRGDVQQSDDLGRVHLVSLGQLLLRLQPHVR